jgi:hypothetical protein
MLGCDCSQDYFMGRPMPAEKLEAWLLESAWSNVPAAALSVPQAVDKKAGVRYFFPNPGIQQTCFFRYAAKSSPTSLCLSAYSTVACR